MMADARLQIAENGSQTANGKEPSAIDHQPSAINIVAFCCHYCAYAAADLAGSLRIQYPPTVRVVKLPCTGKLDVLTLLDAFEHGADGVMVAGCLEGDCHYQRGNLNAKRRVNHIKTLLQEIGLEPDRVRMFNISSAMGRQWAEAVTEMDAQVRALGPSPLRKSDVARNG
jgi:coenzyme F420-reducing hydrogenase delta subunit